jgi:hypothetical protein
MNIKLAVDLSDETIAKLDKFFEEHSIENNIENRSQFMEEAVSVFMAYEMLKNLSDTLVSKANMTPKILDKTKIN